MTKIKLCGLKSPCDIKYVNELAPEYVGFVFAKNSKRYVSWETAEILRKQLNKTIISIGVFVDEPIDVVEDLINRNIIDGVQLHGNEDEDYINALKKDKECIIIKAFCIESQEDIIAANHSSADYVLLDSKAGSGEIFDWSLIQDMKRPYFLAGGLTPENVKRAIAKLQPFAVDASSSLEKAGVKNKQKMMDFVNAVRE